MNSEVVERAGATPDGAVDRDGVVDKASAAKAVQQMFDEIAPKYDLLNHVLSAGVDRHWWKRAAKTFDSILKEPEAHILDLCCGTGDMTTTLVERRPQVGEPVLGIDFSANMLEIARQKLQGKNAFFMQADALHMPLEDASANLVVSTFGFRNLADYAAGLREIRRVLRPGGEIGILEFNEPDGLLGKGYQLYFKHVLPRVGKMISGSQGAYTYLPRSVERFPKPEAMQQMMREAGFHNVTWTPYTFGVAGLFRGRV